MKSGKEIKIARIKEDIKAIDLARQINISPSKLSLIERGYSLCTKEIEEKLVGILKHL
jgi:transcriptional regulator with XRE-family HTH domain